MEPRPSSAWRAVQSDPRSTPTVLEVPSMSLQANVVASLPRVEPDMNYLVPMADRPRNYTFEPPAGVPRSNTNHEAHKMAIYDARPVAGEVSLDANGFALVNHRSAVRDFFDDEEGKRVYHPEVEHA